MSWNVELFVGQIIIPTAKTAKNAITSAKIRNNVGGSKTRGAPRRADESSRDYHLDGCWGEALVLQECMIDRPPETLKHASRRSDIPEACDPKGRAYWSGIEVKNGRPMEGIDKIKENALYVCVEIIRGPRERNAYRPYKIVRICYGETIKDKKIVPPLKWIDPSRKESQKENWVIPEEIDVIEVEIKRDTR